VIRIRPSILLAGLLIFAILMPQSMEASSCALLPPSIIDRSFFSHLLTAVHVGKTIYGMDAFDELPVNILRERLSALSSAAGDPVFDAEKIGFRKKGFTRHYLFTIDGRGLIMRICLTSELGFQPRIPQSDIILEGEIKSLRATYQVFDLKTLLRSDKPRPRGTFHSREADRSS